MACAWVEVDGRAEAARKQDISGRIHIHFRPEIAAGATHAFGPQQCAAGIVLGQEDVAVAHGGQGDGRGACAELGLSGERTGDVEIPRRIPGDRITLLRARAPGLDGKTGIAEFLERGLAGFGDVFELRSDRKRLVAKTIGAESTATRAAEVDVLGDAALRRVAERDVVDTAFDRDPHVIHVPALRRHTRVTGEGEFNVDQLTHEGREVQHQRFKSAGRCGTAEQVGDHAVGIDDVDIGEVETGFHRQVMVQFQRHLTGDPLVAQIDVGCGEGAIGIVLITAAARFFFAGAKIETLLARVTRTATSARTQMPRVGRSAAGERVGGSHRIDRQTAAIQRRRSHAEDGVIHRRADSAQTKGDVEANGNAG